MWLCIEHINKKCMLLVVFLSSVNYLGNLLMKNKCPTVPILFDVYVD